MADEQTLDVLNMLLRRYSSHANVKLQDVAQQVVDLRSLPKTDRHAGASRP